MKRMLERILENISTMPDKIDFIYKIMNLLPVGVVIIRKDTFGANDKFYQLIHQSPSAFHTVEEYIQNCPEDYIRYDEFSRTLGNDSSFTRLYPIHPTSEQEYYIENFTFCITDSSGADYYVTILSDHTPLNNMAIQLDQSNESFHILEELIPDYIFEYDIPKDTLHFPESWKPDGINTDYPHARKWLELHEIIHPDDLPFVLDAMTSTRIFKEPRVLEFRAKYWNKDYGWFRIIYKVIRSKPDNSLRAIGKIGNVDNEHLLTPNDQAQEGIDPNTGLLIPSYMENCVNLIIKEEPPENLCALMLLQLDDFDKLKKSTGDLYSMTIERQVAEKLKHSFRNTDVLGYSRDGCYVIFLRKVPEHIITMRANHVLEAIRNLTFNNATPPQISCSIGIGISPIDGDTYMDLFLKADSAMYLSKARGGNTYSFFNTTVDARQSKDR